MRRESRREVSSRRKVNRPACPDVQWRSQSIRNGLLDHRAANKVYHYVSKSMVWVGSGGTFKYEGNSRAERGMATLLWKSNDKIPWRLLAKLYHLVIGGLFLVVRTLKEYFYHGSSSRLRSESSLRRTHSQARQVLVTTST
jgi:hypothetical protein